MGRDRKRYIGNAQSYSLQYHIFFQKRMSYINSPFLLPSMRTIVEYHFLTKITCPYRILRDDISGKVRRTGYVFKFMFFLWDDGQTNKFCRSWEVFRNFHAQSRHGNVVMLHLTFKCGICIKNRLTSPSVELSFIAWAGTEFTVCFVAGGSVGKVWNTSCAKFKPR